MPIQGRVDFLMEQINAVFRFFERYPGFCELIIVSDILEEGVLKLVWLTITLNKVNHPYVRARIIRYTSHVEFAELVRTGVKSALGDKIVIATNNPFKIEEVDGFGKKDIIVTRFFFDENVYKILA